jgi:hypothetical protein
MLEYKEWYSPEMISILNEAKKNNSAFNSAIALPQAQRMATIACTQNVMRDFKNKLQWKTLYD